MYLHEFNMNEKKIKLKHFFSLKSPALVLKH